MTGTCKSVLLASQAASLIALEFTSHVIRLLLAQAQCCHLECSQGG